MDGPTNQVEQVLYEVKKTIVGQEALLERLLVALLAGGHILVEGVPGLAKTLAVKSLAEAVGGQFHRVQFTPDLVPADILGTRIYHQPTGEFRVSLGPVFTNLLLADEINRAPAKVQSALLEVMQEQQVTIGRETHPVRFAADRHLLLLHHLQQRALHLRRRPVDLVGEQQVGEHRAEPGREVPLLLVEDACPDEVRGHQVGRELDALEASADGVREGLDGHRLGETGDTLDEDVTPREQGHQQSLEEVVLAHDDALDLVQHPLHGSDAVEVDGACVHGVLRAADGHGQ